MKAKLIAISIGSYFLSFAAYSQVETDDMYFRASDRAKLSQGTVTAENFSTPKKLAEASEVSQPINPTDSYSARNVNPEYSSQLTENESVIAEDNYFTPDFQPRAVNQNISNCNCGQGSYYNPYNGSNQFNNFNNFNSPYYNPYGYPGGFNSFNSFSSFGYPYSGFNSGFGLSTGFGWGGFSPGFYGGLGYGAFNGFYDPFGYNGFGGGFFGSGFYPRTRVVFVNADAGNRVVNSRRPTRSANTNNVVTGNSRITTTGNTTGQRNTVSSGRTGNASSQSDYYNKGWRKTQNTNPSGRFEDNNRTINNSNTRTINNNNTRSNFNWGNTNSNSRQGSSGFTPAPSRNSFNGGGSTGGSRSGGSSGGSKTRGRNN